MDHDLGQQVLDARAGREPVVVDVVAQLTDQPVGADRGQRPGSGQCGTVEPAVAHDLAGQLEQAGYVGREDGDVDEVGQAHVAVGEHRLDLVEHVRELARHAVGVGHLELGADGDLAGYVEGPAVALDQLARS